MRDITFPVASIKTGNIFSRAIQSIPVNRAAQVRLNTTTFQKRRLNTTVLRLARVMARQMALWFAPNLLRRQRAKATRLQALSLIRMAPRPKRRLTLASHARVMVLVRLLPRLRLRLSMPMVRRARLTLRQNPQRKRAGGMARGLGLINRIRSALKTLPRRCASKESLAALVILDLLAKAIRRPAHLRRRSKNKNVSSKKHPKPCPNMPMSRSQSLTRQKPMPRLIKTDRRT